MRTSAISSLLFLHNFRWSPAGTDEAILVLKYLLLVRLEKTVGMVLSHGFIDIHVPLEVFFLRRSAYLVVCGHFIHYVKVRGIA
jgi:hypothetical protein